MQKIKHCYKCIYIRQTFDHDIKLIRFVCKHPEWATRKKGYRIINKNTMAKGEIPGWCKLDDYPEKGGDKI